MSAIRACVDDRGVARVTLARPERLNALDTSAFDDLEGAVDLVLATPGARCVVVAGEGRAFCAGADLATATTSPADVAARKSLVLQRLAELPVPVVARVHGHCVAGGLELALCADLIVAASDATFRDAHGRWGLVPAWGLTQRLPRRVGPARAKLMMFTGRPVSGDEALRIGLADVAVPPDQLDRAVEDLVADIVAQSPFTSTEVKRLLIRTDGLSVADGLAHEHRRHPRGAPR
ncbi:enoyl-CoA hydratase/isomerase family protein [Nocardioides sp. BYT-33-1]|uniref:enoyl-CoA hydratase/isomerase family protein n=1 Tax=Nocardioides sp. BYT-33-1 TaxID=3416952 RepID=UPI003F5390CA